jgi:hypothetical protein
MLVMVDAFTRWPIIVPVRNEKAETVANALSHYLFKDHGIPERILSDNGSAFIDAGIQYLYKRLGIKKLGTSAFQPQANGLCERVNRTLNSALSVVVNKYKTDWDDFLDGVVFSMRIAANASTGYSPFELMYGRSPILPLDLLLNPRKPSWATREDYYEQLVERFRDAYYDAHRGQVAASKRNRDRLAEQRAAKRAPFTVGETVLVWGPNSGDITGATTSRFRFRWEPDPVKVLRVLNDTNYEVGRAPGDTATKPRIMNRNRLYPYKPWNADTLSTAPPFYGKDYIPYLQRHPNEPPALSKGRLFVVGMVPSLDCPLPFAVGKVITKHRDGTLTFQWFGNDKFDMFGPCLPGWFDPDSDAAPYYALQPSDPGHLPYKNTDSETVIHVRQTLVPAFELVDNRVPHDVLCELHADDTFDWTYPYYNHEVAHAASLDH